MAAPSRFVADLLPAANKHPMADLIRQRVSSSKNIPPALLPACYLPLTKCPWINPIACELLLPWQSPGLSLACYQLLTRALWLNTAAGEFFTDSFPRLDALSSLAANGVPCFIQQHVSSLLAVSPACFPPLIRLPWFHVTASEFFRRGSPRLFTVLYYRLYEPCGLT